MNETTRIVLPIYLHAVCKALSYISENIHLPQTYFYTTDRSIQTSGRSLSLHGHLTCSTCLSNHNQRAKSKSSKSRRTVHTRIKLLFLY